MKPVLPEELSGLMDGELDAARAREVERQVALNSDLRAEFDRLVETDAKWRASAAAAAFVPAIRVPPPVTAPLSSAAVMTALSVGLICLRMAPKWLDSLTVSFGVQAAALAAVLVGLIWVAAVFDSGHEAHV
jgi:anti-sigma factor RsiW